MESTDLSTRPPADGAPAHAAPPRVRPSRSGKPQGQWKVDGTAPLNPNEEFKAADNGLNVRARIEQTYALSLIHI